MSKLLEEVRDLIRTLHYSYRTEEAYLNWIRQYILFHGKRHPTEMGTAEVRAFLTHLAVKRQVARSAVRSRPPATNPFSLLFKELRRRTTFDEQRTSLRAKVHTSPERENLGIRGKTRMKKEGPAEHSASPCM